ncbi:MAG: PAS domain S-box protein [Halobacteria archaeon]
MNYEPEEPEWLETREYLEAINSIKDGFLLMDVEDDGFRHIKINPRTAEIAGIDADEIEGNTISELYTGQKTDRIRKEFEVCKNRQETVSFEEHFDNESGEVEMEFKLHPIIEDGEVTRISCIARDVTERNRRERRIREVKNQLDFVIQGAEVGTWDWDISKDVVEYNDQFLKLLGYDPEDLDRVDLSIWEQLTVHPDDVESLRDNLLQGMDSYPDDYGLELRMKSRSGDWRWVLLKGKPVEFDEEGNPERAAGIMVNIDEKKRYQVAIEQLYLTTNDLFRSANRTEVVEKVVDTLGDTLGTPLAFYLYDEEEEVLYPVDEYRARETVEENRTIGEEDGIAWTVFDSHRSRIEDDLATTSYFKNPGVSERGELMVPVGGHGLISVFSDEPGEFSDRELKFTEIMGIYADTALSKIDRESSLEEKTDELRERKRTLENLDRINRVLRRVNSGILESDSRDEMEQKVCRRLRKIKGVDMAWIANVNHEWGDSRNFSIEPRAGDEVQGYLDSYTDGLPAEEPTVRSASTGKPVLVDEETTPQLEGWRKKALEYGYERIISVPIKHSGWLYGVLSIYGGASDVVAGETVGVWSELAQILGHGIYRLDQEKASSSADHWNVKFKGGSSSENNPLLNFASDTNSVLNFSSVEIRDSSVRVDFVSEAEIEDQIEPIRQISEDINLVRYDGREGHVVLDMSDAYMVPALKKLGLTVSTIDGTGKSGTVEVEMPKGLDLNNTVKMISSRFDLEFVSKHSGSDGDDVVAVDLFEQITDRQKEVVETSLQEGFFESPRQASGEEIAENLGISPQAFYKHIRNFQDTVVREMFE